MTVEDVVAELEKRGIFRGKEAVAQWFNGIRGKRMDVDDLKALLDVLGTTFEEMYEGGADPEKMNFMRGLVQDIMELTPDNQRVAKRLIHSLREA